MKAIVVIDDILETFFTEKISIKYELVYYPDGHMKELGIHGKQLLKPIPEKRQVYTDFIGAGIYDFDDTYNAGWNACIDEILGEEECIE